MSTQSTQLVIRIDPTLKEKASHLAAREGKSLSELVRELLTNYIREHDLASYIDSLWRRVGMKLEEDAVTPAEIHRIIEEVRAGHDQSRH